MTEIKNQKYISVGGTVGKVFEYAKGTGFELRFQDERMQYPERITVWGAGGEVSEGDRVEVHGFYSDAPEEYQKRDGSVGYGVRRAINAPKVVKREPGQPVQDSWAPAQPGGSGGSQEVPF